MEELHDAIEDAQYVSAISTSDGPRPILHWDKATDEELATWKQSIIKQEGQFAFSMEWYLTKPIGFFLFSQYVKNTTSDEFQANEKAPEPVPNNDINYDYYRLNFLEYIARYRQYPSRQRAMTARKIATLYLMTHEEESLPPKKDIKMDDVFTVRNMIKSYTAEEIKELSDTLLDTTYEYNCVGLQGEMMNDIIERACRKPMATTNGDSSSPSIAKAKFNIGVQSALYPESMFDDLDVVIFEQLKARHWEGFLQSKENERFLNFSWFGEKKAKKEDFFEMRVLGRGGFGMVTACKRGVSGKLYAMKTMSKKRIKMKKAQVLTLNERSALAAVYSPFVIGLNYSFQTKDDVYLILDLMTGGDLSWHLAQKGTFTLKETLYYSSRIVLGLSAIHEKGYVYRDLKPENCLLDEDGRVKITDLGLAVKVTPKLVGAAGTRGYWAPEMLRRTEDGNRIPYNHAVDWFSFGCMLAEFISGQNPFRSEMALIYGMTRGKEKEKAIDCATLEMDPPFRPENFTPMGLDICAKFLDKDPKTRLGANGAEEIKAHPFFKDIDWELVMSDRIKPPFRPPKDVNAASQSEIGTFAEGKDFLETVLDEKDEAVYDSWDWTNPHAFMNEVLEFLIYENYLGKPLLPNIPGGSCATCCTIS